MSAYLGKNGGVRYGSTAITFIDTFDLNTTAETVETTAYGDTSRVRVQTFRDWSANFSGTLDRSDAQQAALLAQLESGTLANFDLRLYDGSTSYWYGSAVLSGWSVNSNVASKVNISFSVLSAGTLYHTA